MLDFVHVLHERPVSPYETAISQKVLFELEDIE